MGHHQAHAGIGGRGIRARDIAAVSNILRRPHEGYLLYGFEDLGVWSVEA